ncbi:hypothetical protein VW29_00630 [Devosia limi DSM 17137]|uniref:Uncharacterized protein n=1 Tax=Devosia limi DSM 17137 TaxID=1121477 RepID=A0A0F5LYS8_9HYPH|nr:DUF6544 family protein [Devosia limi]KKB86797.1 hypothetical protein VW29_00630 [Devosia limi DSM 17137]SHF94275.1 hypothetical protein SAMN02745223_03952 [Devosia limi DSM 17137]
MSKIVLLVIALVVLGGVAAAYWSYRQAVEETERAVAAIVGRAQTPLGAFQPSMVSDLPEVAQRYFNHAIKPGTPLQTTVQLQMDGKFLLGDRQEYQTYDMTAYQVLAPPSEFVWVPSMRSGLLRITGSDALVEGEGWTRFWINSLVPVVNQGASPDLNRSALTRAAMEAIWVPASLLPENGAAWEQTGPNTARVTFSTGVEPVGITLAVDGKVVEIVSMRWSNENADKVFRLQRFGGAVEAEASFGGYTIPSRVKMGNHYGTENYLPFFQVAVTEAQYL